MCSIDFVALQETQRDIISHRVPSVNFYIYIVERQPCQVNRLNFEEIFVVWVEVENKSYTAVFAFVLTIQIARRLCNQKKYSSRTESIFNKMLIFSRIN